MIHNTLGGYSMIIHLANSRGFADHGWLKSRHTFSFADYYDSSRMNFGALRVINDDYIAPGMGFGTHPHRDMEIITIILEGSLRHKDSEGHTSVIRKGDVQIMSAGTGIMHSEFNASSNDWVNLLQIWVLPKQYGIKPRYGEKSFLNTQKMNDMQLVVSPDGRDGSLAINQDAFFSISKIQEGKSLQYERKFQDNGVYVFVISGELKINDELFHPRDGVGITQIEQLKALAVTDSEVLWMEVPL